MNINKHFESYVDHYVQQTIESGGTWVSKPLVMASAAGWYIGQVCVYGFDGPFLQPYDRLTDYMFEDQALSYWKSAFAAEADDIRAHWRAEELAQLDYSDIDRLVEEAS